MCLCLRIVLYDIRLVNTFIIVICSAMNYSLLMPNLVAFSAKLNELQKTEFHFALEVSFSVHIQLHTAQNLLKT